MRPHDLTEEHKLQVSENKMFEDVGVKERWSKWEIEDRYNITWKETLQFIQLTLYY
jgi:hypothetical protein